MLFWRYRTRTREYKVLWDALLEVSFSDFNTQMPVKVINFSNAGSLLEAENIFLNKRHLIDAHHRPRLNLKIFLPEGVFESEVNIIWYRWSVEKIAFEISVNFKDILKEISLFADALINNRRHQHKAIAMS